MKKIALVLILWSFVFSGMAGAKNFKGAEYRTNDAFLYGRFEVRMKSTPVEGVLSTFFTYFDGTPEDPWATNKWNEIDLEVIGRYRNDVQFNTITPGQTNHVSHIWTDFDPADDYHTYAFEWTPDYVSWYIDGVMVRKQTGSHIQTITRAQKLMMNTWNPAYTNWVGTMPVSSLPAFTFYDWVSYATYTPGSGTFGEGNNFTPSWKDEFDTFDESRWSKATHSFEGNNCDFIPENAVIKNGKLILCLTNPTNIGYTDITAPTFLYGRQQDTVITVQFSEKIEKTTAELVANYFINPLTIKSAVINPDSAGVILITSKPDTSKNYMILIEGIKDRFEVPNTLSSVYKSLLKVKPVTFPLWVDVGSTVPNAGYRADQEFLPSTEFGYSDGRNQKVDTAISGTEEDVVLQTERTGIVAYQVRVPAGKYKVTLQFAEKYYSQAGRRVFDITVEQSSVKKKDIDIVDLVGGNSAYQTVFESVSVSDGILDIHFSAQESEAFLAGLKIEYTGALTQVENDNSMGENSKQIRLLDSYPNPFNGSTTIRFEINQPESLTFHIFDITGREIYKRILGPVESGVKTLNWDGTTLNGVTASSGTYFYHLRGTGISPSGSLTYIK